MTLALGITTPKSIWMLVDRRISYANPLRRPRDDAMKCVSIETDDGVALLGYAGLGETVGGVEPSEWLVRALQGQRLGLEASLGAVFDATSRQFGPHLLRLGNGRPVLHTVLAPAFIGDEPKFFLIQHEVQGAAGTRRVFTRLAVPEFDRHGQHGIFIRACGSGAIALRRFHWVARLRDALKANCRGKVSDAAIESNLAAINYRAYQEMQNSVGRRCIVVRRDIPSGGYFTYFDGLTHDQTTERQGIPTVSRGVDLQDLLSALMPGMEAHIAAGRDSPLEHDWDAVERHFNEVRSRSSDERLD